MTKGHSPNRSGTVREAAAERSRSASGDEVILFVDLDGTLVATDTSVEAVFRLLRENLAYAALLPLWLLRGQAYLKRQVAQRVTLEVERLPYLQDFVDYLTAERAKGRRMVLATAADSSYARQVADHLGLFDDAIGSDGRLNLAGTNKLAKIRSMVRDDAFDYAGDNLADLKIFQHARRALVVNPVLLIQAATKRMTNIEKTFEAQEKRPRDILRVFRPARWLLNLLVLLPLAFSAPPLGIGAWIEGALACLAFCLAASAVYAFDDLLHLPERRQLGPDGGTIAEGKVSIERVAWALLAFWGMAFGLAAVLSGAFALALAAFVTLSVLAAQDWYRLPRAVTAMALALVRVLGGGALLALWPSIWMLALGLLAGIAIELLWRPKTGYI